MLDLIRYENPVMVNMVVKPQKCNMAWSVDYMLMDSKGFMGGNGCGDYDNVIEMFCRIWEVHEYKLLI
jgi:hypothetical protein